MRKFKSVLAIISSLCIAFSFSFSTMAITPRYIPCPNSGCRGAVTTSTYVKPTNTAVPCQKYPNMYYDIKVVYVEITEIRCSECSYYDMDSRYLYDGGITCNH